MRNWTALSLRNPPATIKERVVCAHKIQLERFRNEGIFFNAQMNAAQIEKYCALREEDKELLRTAFARMELSSTRLS